MNYYDQAGELVVKKTSDQKKVYAQVLRDVLRRLDKTFNNFYKGSGYPRFRGKNRYDSFTYPQYGFKLEGGRVSLSKIGSVRVFQHREIEGIIKTCTIKKEIEQWYVIFTVEIERQIEQIPIKTAIGIDVGLKSLITLSNGEQIEPPKFLRLSEHKLIQEQKRLSRKKKGSKNRNKQRIKVAKVHRKIKNQRKDFAHKTSRMLVNRFDMIVFEKLNIRGMIQNHHLAKSIADAGWYQLQNFTAYKAEYAGKWVKFCIANKTSQECHICGNIEHITLADRTFHCSRCGNIKDRDVNASINIKNRCTDGLSGIEACKSDLIRDTMKQEASLICRY